MVKVQGDARRIKDRKIKQRRRALMFVILWSSTGSADRVWADLPTGGNVAAGQAAISRSGAALNVDASTNRTIVNWDSFNVGVGNVANFNLPNVNAAILNRVTTPNMPSTIAGVVNSNGHVMLVNPSGIMVTASGMVNTNGFTASTFDVTNQDFLDGGALKFKGDSNASIVNDGTVLTGNGGAHIIANQISNHGTITSNGGNITMSGGGEVTLESGVTYVQPSMATIESGISPTAGLIQNTGAIRATGAATSGGEVYLVNPNGRILHDGTITAGQAANLPSDLSDNANRTQEAYATGGKVQIEADDITLTAESSIEASGTSGGGDVLVGGDWQGSGDMTHATTLTMEQGAIIDASATDAGDGGTIVLWSDITDIGSITKAFGTLLAKAGQLAGNGGRIETSGGTIETDGIVVDAGAVNGDGGLWLIDPFNYVIDAVAASNIVSALNSGTSVTITTTSNNAAHGSSGNSSDLGDITISSDIVTGAMAGDATLTLQATRHINVNSNIDATQNGNAAKLNVSLLADTDLSGDGINIVSANQIKTNGGDLQFGDGSTANIGGATVKVGGDVYVTGSIAQSIETSGGDITINGETIVANSSVDGVTLDSAGGDIVFGGVVNSGNQYTYVDGPDGQANSWDWARTDARNGTSGGSSLGDSYMVTITSRLENAIAGIAADYRGAWIGAYRPDTAGSYDWQWADGPEAGQNFFVQSSSGSPPNGGGSAQPGWYSNFGPNEPNGALSASGESRGQFFGNAGLWNDLGATTTFAESQTSVYAVLGYVRETNLSPTALSVNAGSGTVAFGGGVGGGKALASLDVISGSTTMNGTSLITTGAQNFSSALSIAGQGDLSVRSSRLTASGDTSLTANGNITLESAIDVSSVANADILLKATGNITSDSGRTLETNGGDITLWSDSDDSGQGYISVGQDSTLDSRTESDRLAGTHTIGGGKITLAGGADSGSGSPSGFATAGSSDTSRAGVSLGDDTGATNNTQVYSGGGDVLVKGRADSDRMGVLWIDGGTIDAGDTGLVRIDAAHQGDGHGIELGGFNQGTTAVIRSAGGSSGVAAIQISGDSLSTSGHAGVRGQRLTIEAEGNGGIGISGTTGSNAGPGVGIYNDSNLLTANDNIAIDGGAQGVALDDTTIGRKAGSSVTSSVADVTIIGDRLTLSNTNAINTTGTVTVEPSSTSFGSTLNWPLTNLSLSSDIGGLTLGKVGNTSLIVIGQSITTAGEQNYHGPVSLTGDLTFTTTNSDIGFYGTVNGSSRDLVTNTGTGTTTFAGIVGGSGELDTVNVSGRLNVNADLFTSGSQTFGDTITIGGTGTRTFTAGSLSAQAIVGGSHDLALTTDDLSLGGDVSSTGSLTIAPRTNGTDIGVGNSSGSFSLDNTDLSRLLDGFSSITIGSSTSGDLSVGGITSLSDDLTLWAGAGADLHVDDAISWSSDNALTLAAGNDIRINDSIGVGGAAATLNLHYGGTDGIAAPDAGDSFYIDIAGGKSIDFSSTSASLNIGNQAYTLIDSVGEFTGMNPANRYALAGDLDLSATTYSGAVFDSTFTGMLDGLGHVADGMVIRADNGGKLGLFRELNGATVRHLGVTNFSFESNSALDGAGGNEYRVGGLAGNIGGAGVSVSSVTTLDGVWSQGTIATRAGSRQKFLFGGGLIGSQNGGTMNLSRAFGAANVSSQGSYSDNLALGGLIGDIGINTDLIVHTVTNSATVAFDLNNTYATGSVVQGAHGGYYGAGGLVGVVFSTGNSFADSYSWGNVVGSGSFGGIAGYASGSDFHRVYTTQNTFGAGGNYVDSYTGSTLSTATNNGTQLPTNWSASTWAIGSKPTLNSLPAPPEQLYVQVATGTSSIYGDVLGISYQIVDKNGLIVNFGQGDYVNLSGVTGDGIYTLGAGANSGNYNSVSYLTGLSLTGSDSGLFTLNPFSTAGSHTITPRSITAVLGTTGATKVYDGTIAGPSGWTPTFSFTNILAGDSATLNSGSSVFNASQVATANTLTLSGLSLAGITGSNGSLLGDYVLANSSAVVAATITPKPLVVSGIFAEDKIYDGMTDAAINMDSVSLPGAISGDNVSVSSATGTFASKNVGSNVSVTLSGLGLTGADAGNYTLTSPSGITADITPKALSVTGIVGVDRVYDATTSATVDSSGITFNGLVSGDSVTLDSITAEFADKNAASGKTVSLSGATYGGADAGNYTFTDQTTTTADITAKAITIAGLAAANKTYDQTTTATVDATGIIFTGMLGGDNLTASGTTGAFADKNAGTGKQVAFGGTTLAGTDAGNYFIAGHDNATADISPMALTISGLSGVNKVYDATTIGTLSGTATVVSIAGDDVTVQNNAIVNFDSADVGSAKPLTVTGFSLSGADAGNYTLAQPTGLVADITPATLYVIANNDAKFVTQSDVLGYAGVTYDGFVGGEDHSVLGGSLAITRTIAGETAGTYTDALSASGLTSTNYSINLVPGDFTIVPAEELLVRFGNTQSTYGNTLGLNLLSAQYMDSGNTIHTLTPTGVTGTRYSFSDGVGGTAQFDIGLSGSTLSSSGNLNVGTFDLGLSNLIESSSNFSNTVNIVGNHTINQAAISVSAGGVSKVYDGNVSMNNITLSQTGRVAGDVVILSGQGSYASQHAGTGLDYTVGNLSVSGTDAGNYYLSTGMSFAGNDGVITPKAVTITAPSVTKIYDGNSTSNVTAAHLQAFTDALGIAGDGIDSITLTYDNKNVGTGKTLTASTIGITDGNGGGNYNITFADDTNSSITRLGNVTWIGGATGDWNDPANWAGGAIPDLANVANVIIPVGVTPTFGNSVAGPVQLDSILGGNLDLTGGTLAVTDSSDLQTFTQSGGSFNTGSLSVEQFTQSGGSTGVSGSLSITDLAVQSGSTSLQVGGVTNIESTGDVLLGGNNDFVGSVNVSGNNIELNDVSGGIALGNINASGTLDVSTTGGNISSSAGSHLTVGGPTTLNADGEVQLGQSQNQFGDVVNVIATAAELVQTLGDLLLGNVNVTGDFQARSSSGNLSQPAGGTIQVGGDASFTAKREIKLDSLTNQFAAGVTVNAPQHTVNATHPVSIRRTGAAMGAEVSSQTLSQTINDTFTRPANEAQDAPSQRPAATQSLLGWYQKFVRFVRNLEGGSTDLAGGGLPELEVKEIGSDTFVGNRH